MNIREAKEEIARTFRAYMKRKPDGSLRIPPRMQRPVLLIGPPGIGKTAIMEQIAREEGIGLVAYSMTHHTRQSAVGLPMIREEEYGGVRRAVTEYTMSEIVASIYDCMKRTGHTQGILFLDEINCVSETLSPVMLQLLQSKTFGTHPLPEGWLIAAAGNPPEYNRSVRELDMATLDRVKHMEVEAELSVWLDYARARDVHPSVIAYLTLHPDHFYRIENTVRGQLFVTARGWEDLSVMLRAYEEDGQPVESSLVIQYLQHDEIARSFYLFYDLFRHFRAEWESGEKGNDAAAAGWRGDLLRNAHISEAMAAASHLLAGIRLTASQWRREEILEQRVAEALEKWEKGIGREPDEADERTGAGQAACADGLASADGPSPADILAFQLQSRREALAVRLGHQVISSEEEHLERLVTEHLEELWSRLIKERAASGSQARQIGQEVLEGFRRRGQALAQEVLDRIRQACRLLEQYPADEPLLYLVSDLTQDEDCAALLTAYPCPPYEALCRRLLLFDQEEKLLEKLQE